MPWPPGLHPSSPPSHLRTRDSLLDPPFLTTLQRFQLLFYPSAKSQGFCLFFGLHTPLKTSSVSEIASLCMFMKISLQPILSSSIVFQTQAKSSECHLVPLPLCFLKGILCLGIWYYLSMFYTQHQPLYLICSYECIKTYVIMSLLKTL